MTHNTLYKQDLPLHSLHNLYTWENSLNPDYESSKTLRKTPRKDPRKPRSTTEDTKMDTKKDTRKRNPKNV